MARKKHHDKMARSSAGMISEDKGAIANMPQAVKYVAYPKYRVGMDEGIDDTISKIDRQMDEDVNGARRHMKPTSY